MKVLVINGSPKQNKSSTYLVAKTMIEQLKVSRLVNVEHIDTTALPHIDTAYADTLCSIDANYGENKGSLALSDQLIYSLNGADIVIITSPMHNYSLPSCLKSWIDHVVRAGKTFEITSTGKRALLIDKPVYVLISSGGVFSGKGAYQPNYFTPYMKSVLATIGFKNPHFFTIEGTAESNTLVKKRIEEVEHQVCKHLAETFI